MSVRPALLLALALPCVGLASERPRHYDVQHYRVELRLSPDGAFENTAQVTLTPSSTLRQVELDSYGLDVKAVTLGGAEVPFTLSTDDAAHTGLLTLKPKAALPAKKPATFEIRYTGKAGTAHEGVFRADGEDPKQGPFFFTHFEPWSARRFVPSNDRPEDKATFELLATVDAKFTLLSNGKKLKDETFTQNGDTLRRVHWTQEQPIPLYSFAFAAGQFEPVEVGTSITPATIWVQPGQKDRAFVATDATLNLLSFQQAFTGVKYPWAKYDQVVVPRYEWSGMENTSLSLMRENKLVLAEKNYLYGKKAIASLISHELAHQWFGNLVTCDGFDDLWLNEGFATFLGKKAEDDYYGNDLIDVEQAVHTFVHYFQAEDGPRSHPLVEKKGDSRGSFDSTSYTKGAHVLRMLEHWVGPEQFKKGVKAYLEKYRYGAASSEDFFAAFMKATGTEKELKGFRDSWLYQRGYPVIFPEANWNGSELEVTIRQQPNHAGEKGHFTFKLPVTFHRDGEPSYAKQEVIVVDKPVVKVKFALPAAPKWVNWNREGLALARINVPSVSQEEWIRGARQDPDPVWRTMAAFVLMGELVNVPGKEQKTPSTAAMDALMHVLKKDASPYVREAVLSRLADSPWRRLPEEFGPVFLEQAQKPEGLPYDAVGTIRVRRAAMTALGKVDHREGRRFLLREVMKPDLDLNYLPAVAEGAARLGDPEALSSVRAAVLTAQGRGYEYFRQVAPALGSVPHPDAVGVLADLLHENRGNHELLRALEWSLQVNVRLRGTPEFAAFVKRFVLENEAWGMGPKARMMTLLDDVKTNEAKQTLLAISEGSGAEALKASATRVLDRNFPGARPPAAVPAKGKPSKKK